MEPNLRGVLLTLSLVLALGACTESAPGARPGAGSSPAASVPAPPAPSESVSTAAPATRLTLTIVGDIMLGRGVAAAHVDPTQTLRPLSPLLRQADITVGNLENTLSVRGQPQQPGDDSFAAEPAVLGGLARAGFDVLSLANNHTGDYGERALLDTVATLRRSDIAGFGAGRDLRAALRPAIVERSGVRVGFLGFNAIGETPEAAVGRPGALSVSMPPRTGPLDRAELRRVLDAVRRLSRQVDVVVVLPHWGTQYTHRPEPVQRTVGRRLVAAGADLVVGGHPHWVQRVERHRGTVIAHSLGNFVFDMDFMEETMEGVILTATIEGPDIVDVAFIPYRLDAGFTPRKVQGPAARGVLAGLGSGR